MTLITKALFSTSLVMIIFCISSNETFAQDNPNPETTQQRKPDKEKMQEYQAAYNTMLDSLGLDDQQREDIDFINTKYRAQMQQIRQNSDGDREAMRSKMMELRDKQNVELKGVFTEEQYTDYQNWIKENRPSRRKGGQERN